MKKCYERDESFRPHIPQYFKNGNCCLQKKLCLKIQWNFLCFTDHCFPRELFYIMLSYAFNSLKQNFLCTRMIEQNSCFKYFLVIGNGDLNNHFDSSESKTFFTLVNKFQMLFNLWYSQKFILLIYLVF